MGAMGRSVPPSCFSPRRSAHIGSHHPNVSLARMGTVETGCVHPPGACSATEGVRTTIDQTSIWYLSHDAAWLALCAAHAAAQQTLDKLAMTLRRLGRYDRRLADAGGMHTAPNPLAPTVVAALDPDAELRCIGALGAVPQFVRCVVRAHTPKMLYVQFWGTTWSRSAQHQFFVCPTDDDWHELRVAQQAVSTACGAFRDMLTGLGHNGDA